jgi:hypothetical protein
MTPTALAAITALQPIFLIRYLGGDGRGFR